MGDGAPDIGFTKLRRDAEDFQTLRRELDGESFGLSLMSLRPGQRLRVHRHKDQEEVYLVLEGTLTLVIEGEPHELGVDDLARVGPQTRRQLTNPHSERVLLLAIGAAGKHVSRDGIAWTDWDEEGPGRSPQEVPFPDDLPV